MTAMVGFVLPAGEETKAEMEALVALVGVTSAERSWQRQRPPGELWAAHRAPTSRLYEKVVSA